MKQTCENCKWRYGVHKFECHRFPPQSTGRKVKEIFGEIFGGGIKMKVPEFRYPSVDNNDFCGEFKKRAKKKK